LLLSDVIHSISIGGLKELYQYGFDDGNSKTTNFYIDSNFKVIDKNSTKEDMLKHVAFHVTWFGHDSMVEGVGYVGYNGRKPTKEHKSGIMVGEDYDEYDFEIVR